MLPFLHRPVRPASIFPARYTFLKNICIFIKSCLWYKRFAGFLGVKRPATLTFKFQEVGQDAQGHSNTSFFDRSDGGLFFIDLRPSGGLGRKYGSGERPDLCHV